MREKNSRLAAFCKDRHFPHPRFAIATNLRMQALDFVQFFLISTHTHTHITCQTPKQAPQENKSKISKSYERSFFFYGIIPLKVRKAIPFNTTKYTLCLAYQFSIFSQCVFSIVHYENVIECNESHNSKANFVESYIVWPWLWLFWFYWNCYFWGQYFLRWIQHWHSS